MRVTFLAAAVAVAACLGFTSPATAQQPTDLAKRVEQLERRLAAVELKVAPPSNLPPLGATAACPTGCDCGVKSSTAAPKAAAAARTAPVAGVHSHTCPRCLTTWSHTGQPGDDSHHCPRCGTEQRVVSSGGAPSSPPPDFSLTPAGYSSAVSGGCANGACAAPVQYSRPARGGLFGRR